jgi:hypothetical protein
MDLIELIFKLVRKFVPISMEDYQRMYTEADDWRSKLNPDSSNKVEKLYTDQMNKWFVRLFIAVMYIPLVKWIMDIQRPDDEDDNKEVFD